MQVVIGLIEINHRARTMRAPMIVQLSSGHSGMSRDIYLTMPHGCHKQPGQAGD
jgi:hypothetical protein